MYYVGYKNLNNVFSAESGSEFITQLKFHLYNELVDWIDNTTNVSGGTHLSQCDEFELNNTENLLRELLTLSTLNTKEELLIFNYVNDIYDITTDEHHNLGTITLYHLENETSRFDNLNKYQLKREYKNELLRRNKTVNYFLDLEEVLKDIEERQLFNVEKETIDLDNLKVEVK